MTIGRVAILTQDHGGRAACHYCGPCERGCSTGSYFSSLSSTLPAAQATGNLTVRTDSVVESLDYDPATRRVRAVRVVDATTRERREHTARVVFLCAATVGSTQILLNSRSEAFPHGLANRSGALGHHLMDHTFGLAGLGLIPGHEDAYFYGHRPNGIYVPRFRNVDRPHAGFVRGYNYQGRATRLPWRLEQSSAPPYGRELKEALRTPGPWALALLGFGECLPRAENRMALHPTKRDRFGIPQVTFIFTLSENERAMRRDAAAEAERMLRAAGATQVMTSDAVRPGGGAMHEMGTARMGRDPRASVLNGFNQAHDVANLFVTDGSCMTSSGCVSPSLTFMALTARAADHAAGLLRDGVL
jgi:choline dehydrogenase-like flavoprotein